MLIRLAPPPSGAGRITRGLVQLASSILFVASGATAEDSLPPNVLMVVADDLGVDMVGVYGEGVDPPPTPTIDALAHRGVLFRHCWANPVCSPTRATLQTGRYSFRTGIGMVVHKHSMDLPLEEVILPEVLTSRVTPSYACAAIGKWHLGNELGERLDHPNRSGYEHFAGSMGNIGAVGTYFNWPKVVNGTPSRCTTYVTTDNVDEALAWIRTAPEPWFCYLSFVAPHDPVHAPPAHLHSQRLPAESPRERPRPYYRAIVEAMDTELGRLLETLGPTLERTNVIFLGDNGTPQTVCEPPFMPGHAKLTLFEGGVNVPLIIAGPAVREPGASCTALVNTTDLFCTVLDLTGAAVPENLRPVDSVSLVPYLTSPSQPSHRSWVYAELFQPNGFDPPTTSRRAIRDARYKLIRTRDNPELDRLYDLWQDPFETVDLLEAGPGTLLGERATRYHELRIRLTDLFRGRSGAR